LMSRCWLHRSRARLRSATEIMIVTTARCVPGHRGRWRGEKAV
jgi:hypothetical protein